MKRAIAPLKLRHVVLGLVTVLVLVVVLHFIEIWRGERAWANARERLRAAGEPMTVGEWLPTPPADEENFMMNPVFIRRCGWGQTPAPRPERWEFEPAYARSESGAPVPFPHEAMGSADGSIRADVVALAASLPPPFAPLPGATAPQAAAALLKWMEPWEPDFRVLAEAERTRPASYLPIDWTARGDAVTWEPLQGWLDVPHVLQLRAFAQIAAGDGAGALESITISLRMAQATAAKPCVAVSFVLSAATSALMIRAVNEGLGSGVWSEPQLKQIDDLVAAVDLRSGLREALRGERLYFCRQVEDLIATTASTSSLQRGWMWKNRTTVVDWQLRQEQRLQSPSWARAADSPSKKFAWYNPDAWLSIVLLKGLAGLESRVDEVDCSLLLARIAIALERHRLAHRDYPVRIEELTPFTGQELPLDPFSGKSFRYTLETDRPRVWSVGHDQRDDGGPGEEEGADDIVWTYQAR